MFVSSLELFFFYTITFENTRGEGREHDLVGSQGTPTPVYHDITYSCHYLHHVTCRHACNAIYPSQETPDPVRVQAKQRSNRATFVYFLIMASFNLINSLGIARGMIKLRVQDMSAVAIAFLYALITIIISFIRDWGLGDTSFKQRSAH